VRVKLDEAPPVPAEEPSTTVAAGD
jgi:hypothetical protein